MAVTGRRGYPVTGYRQKGDTKIALKTNLTKFMPIFLKQFRILYMKNVLFSYDIFYTTLPYHKFILGLHVKDYTRITKQI
jgi:hypothetical protein